MFSLRFKLVNVFHLNPCLRLLYIKLSSVFFLLQFIFYFDFPSYFPLLYSLVICSVPCTFKLIPAISWGCRLIFSFCALCPSPQPFLFRWVSPLGCIKPSSAPLPLLSLPAASTLSFTLEQNVRCAECISARCVLTYAERWLHTLLISCVFHKPPGTGLCCECSQSEL